MTWIEVDEPFAKPPRPRVPRDPARFSGPLEPDRGWAGLSGVAVDPSAPPDLSACSELTVEDSVIDGLTLLGPEPLRIEIFRSGLDGCDLSQATIGTIRHSRLTGCKLTGTDFSGGLISDVVFDRCQLRFANLRMATLDRVSFVDCVLDDVDGYELKAQHVDFPGSTVTGLNLDRLEAVSVDFRHAESLLLNGIAKLSGCLVSEHQLPALSYSLAAAAGLAIERTDSGD